jgi:hypothetical protein
MNEFLKLVANDAFKRATTATYRIDGMCGPIALNLPSVAAAKERYLDTVREGLDEGDTIPEVQFRLSRESPDGDGPCEEHVECVENGHIDACIWLERATWPGVVLGSSVLTERHLAMVSDAVSPFPSCQHRRLLCVMIDPDGVPGPGIMCVDCKQTWTPAPFVGAELATT